MELDQSTIADLHDLEAGMWRSQTRFDRVWMDRHLAEEFVEFGRSGRRYDRDATLAATPIDFSATIPLLDFAATPLAPGVVLVTYVSEFTFDGETEVGRRSSIWVQEADQWRMRFHQGTPLPDHLR